MKNRNNIKWNQIKDISPQQGEIVLLDAPVDTENNGLTKIIKVFYEDVSIEYGKNKIITWKVLSSGWRYRRKCLRVEEEHRWSPIVDGETRKYRYHWRRLIDEIPKKNEEIFLIDAQQARYVVRPHKQSDILRIWVFEGTEKDNSGKCKALFSSTKEENKSTITLDASDLLWCPLIRTPAHFCNFEW